MIIGLTGVYCSGKSTVENILKNKHHFFVIDVDKTGHLALEEKTPELVTLFGKEILTNDRIDRRKLGNIVFHDKNQLQTLNAVVHPWMVEYVRQKVAENRDKNICIDAALLFEMGLDVMCPKIILVNAPFLKIVRRAMARDKHSLKKILKILSAQKVREVSKKNLNNADIYNIYNSGHRQALEEKTDRLLNHIMTGEPNV